MDASTQRAFAMAEEGAPDAGAAREALGQLRAEAGRLLGRIDGLEGAKATAEEEIVSLSARLEPVEHAAMALEAALGHSAPAPR
ncbi:MAG: hypothetical protein ACXIVO_12905 [Glycocaulis sp.]